jgi:hypothetical protein
MHVQNYSDECSATRQFELVDQMTSLLYRIRREINARDELELTTAECEPKDYEAECQELRQEQLDELNDFDQRWGQMEADLKARHDRQLQEFEQTWHTNLSKPADKSTTRLLHLKQLERSALLSRDYSRVSKIGKEINNHAQQDQQMHQRRLESQYREDRQHLVLTQEYEMELFDRRREEERETLLTTHDRALHRMQRRLDCVASTAPSAPSETQSVASYRRPSATLHANGDRLRRKKYMFLISANCNLRYSTRIAPKKRASSQAQSYTYAMSLRSDNESIGNSDYLSTDEGRTTPSVMLETLEEIPSQPRLDDDRGSTLGREQEEEPVEVKTEKEGLADAIEDQFTNTAEEILRQCGHDNDVSTTEEVAVEAVKEISGDRGQDQSAEQVGEVAVATRDEISSDTGQEESAEHVEEVAAETVEEISGETGQDQSANHAEDLVVDTLVDVPADTG